MKHRLNFPKSAQVNRVLPKNKVYENANPSAKIKQYFVDDLEKIVWAYKLSEQTINLPAKNQVEEIQVFHLFLKNNDIHEEVISTIDKAIPSLIFFILEREGEQCYQAAYKRQSESDHSQHVISSYFRSDWFATDSAMNALPVSLNLEALYHTLIASLIPLPVRAQEGITELIERHSTLKKLEKEQAKLTKRLNKEKQFNRKVELNRELKNLNDQINELKIGS